MQNINELIKETKCIEGGSKEAALKVQAALKNISTASETILLLERSGVDTEEFLRSVRKLAAYAQTHPDTKVELWYCETDCMRASNPNCPYRQFMVSNGEMICPRYIEEDK